MDISSPKYFHYIFGLFLLAAHSVLNYTFFRPEVILSSKTYAACAFFFMALNLTPFTTGLICQANVNYYAKYEFAFMILVAACYVVPTGDVFISCALAINPINAQLINFTEFLNFRSEKLLVSTGLLVSQVLIMFFITAMYQISFIVREEYLKCTEILNRSEPILNRETKKPLGHDRTMKDIKDVMIQEIFDIDYTDPSIPINTLNQRREVTAISEREMESTNGNREENEASMTSDNLNEPDNSQEAATREVSNSNEPVRDCQHEEEASGTLKDSDEPSTTTKKTKSSKPIYSIKITPASVCS